jgi:hypothetical protein
MIFLICFVTYFIIMIQCCDVPFLKRNGERERERERERETERERDQPEHRFTRTSSTINKRERVKTGCNNVF